MALSKVQDSTPLGSVCSANNWSVGQGPYDKLVSCNSLINRETIIIKGHWPHKSQLHESKFGQPGRVFDSQPWPGGLMSGI